MKDVEQAVDSLIGEFKSSTVTANTIVTIVTQCMILLEKSLQTKSGPFKEAVCVTLISRLICSTVEDANTRRELLQFNTLIVPTMIRHIISLAKSDFKRKKWCFICNC